MEVGVDLRREGDQKLVDSKNTITMRSFFNCFRVVVVKRLRGKPSIRGSIL